MASKYAKLNKDQLVQLLLEKDSQFKELNTRLDLIESIMEKEDRSNFQDRLVKIERNEYQLEQYCRRESVEIAGLPEDITVSLIKGTLRLRLLTSSTMPA